MIQRHMNGDPFHLNAGMPQNVQIHRALQDLQPLTHLGGEILSLQPFIPASINYLKQSIVHSPWIPRHKTNECPHGEQRNLANIGVPQDEFLKPLSREPRLRVISDDSPHMIEEARSIVAPALQVRR